MGASDVIKTTWNEAGYFGFYRGLPSMVYFAAPKASIRFASFETVSGLLTGPNGEDKFGLGGAKGFVAGLGAGTMEAIFVTTPQETIKVRLINGQCKRKNQYSLDSNNRIYNILFFITSILHRCISH